jgi:hypothetical protein
MNYFLITLVILIPLFIILMVQYRRNQREIDQIRAGRKTLDDAEIWLKHAEPSEAVVVSKSVVISPDAPKIAKVDLELRIRQTSGEPVVRQTCWLVEVGSLSQLEIGSSVNVKLDGKRPGRIFPAVPWARAWLFGDPRK